MMDETSSPERGLEQLHKRTQIRRMRQLAEVALEAYDLPTVRLTLIAHLFNTTFRVDTPTGQRYVLRIHRAGTPTVASVGAEMAWLAALRRDTTLEVPAPMATRDGSLLTVATTPGVPRPHICVLFRWLPGRRLRRRATPQQMKRVGALMAHLQNHASGWVPSRTLERGRVDWPIEAARHLPDPFAPEVITSIYSLVASALSVAEAEQVVVALERVRVAEAVLGKGPDAFGLIHADLHFGNLLFGRDTVRVIDFDDCGFGPHLYDHAVMLSEILDWPEYPALRAGLLAGYRQVRTLHAEQEALLDTFIVLRRMQDALWRLEGRKHPALGPNWAEEARQNLTPIAAFLAGEPLR